MNREELIEQLRDSGADVLAAFWSVPASRLDDGGYENGWTVKEIMAHVASMEFTYRRLPDVARGNGDARTRPDGGSFDMDAYNARQVDRRTAMSPEELAAEFVRGRGVLIAEVGELDAALLQTPVRSAGGVTGTLAEVISRTAAGHVRTHSADFSRAAGATPTEGERAGAAVVIAAEEAAARLDGVSQERWLQRASSGDWCAAGIAGHLIEMMPYWAARIARVGVESGELLGRDLDAPERIGGVIDGESLSPAEAIAALRQASAEAALTLRRIPAGSWQRRVQHERYGDLSLTGAVKQLLVSHAREHVEQIAGAISAGR